MFLNTLIRPVYYGCILGALLIGNFYGAVCLILLPAVFFETYGLYWIFKNNKKQYLKAIPLMIFLPFLQELFFTIGFIAVLCGVKLQNAWK